MSNPTPGDMHVNTPLTNVSVAFIQSQTSFVADSVFPSINVAQQSNLYYRYSRADWNRAEAQVRAPGTESAGGGWNVSTDSYFADVWAVHKDIADQDYANADAQFNLDAEAAQWVTQQMLLRRDMLWVQEFMTASKWTGDQTGVSASPTGPQFLQWNDANSDPIANIRSQAIAVTERGGGFRPNVLVLGPRAYEALVNHPDIIERIKYSERGIVGNDLLAALFGVERVVVPWTVRDTATEGATEANSFAFGKAALLVFAAPNAGLRTPSAGYTFNWSGLLGASDGVRIKRFELPALASTRIEGEIAVDMKIVAPELGVYFASAVA
jgi:hypothetical protein